MKLNIEDALALFLCEDIPTIIVLTNMNGVPRKTINNAVKRMAVLVEPSNIEIYKRIPPIMVTNIPKNIDEDSLIL